MKLTQQQIDAYNRDGFIVFPNLIGADEVALLKAELERVGNAQDPRVVRERTGGPRIVYGMHEDDGPTSSSAYKRLVESARLAQPAKDILREDVYVYHTKANTKMPLGGAIYEWHQDFVNWNAMDGTPEPRMVTAMVLLDRSTELGGCLYFIPGSHKYGIVQPDYGDLDPDAALDAVRYRAEPVKVPNEKMFEIVRTCGEPVAITGEPGTVAFFHADMIHGSGHNLSIHGRWLLTIAYSADSNRPQAVPKPRPEFKAARTARALAVSAAPSILG
jgi:ectoine hydroxylase